MNKIKKGDIVGRLSYKKDVLFKVVKIIKKENREIVLLKGLIERIEADSPLEDIEVVSEEIVIEKMRWFERSLESRIKRCIQNNSSIFNKVRKKNLCGTILHLDGDKKYAEKSLQYYKKVGLNAVVKNIIEKNQYKYVRILLLRYKPDILVITGHDGMIKKESNYNDVSNYRNSRYFIETVKEARSIKNYGKELAIFAGACQSYYEVLIKEGANFASSPARILIDFIDPLIVAEKIATTDNTKYITINDIKGELRDGEKGVGGVGVKGKKLI